MQTKARAPYFLIPLFLTIVVLALVLFGRGDGPEISEAIAGDISEEIGAMSPDEMVAQAEALLATDRPWRAARVMRAFAEATEQNGAMAPEHRVLAARAEAGSGAWAEAL